MGRIDGRVLFVPYAIPGEFVRVVVTRSRSQHAWADLVSVLKPSPHRVLPRCPHFGQGSCGGCQLQHMSYEAQLDAKLAVVKDQIARIGKFPAARVLPVIPSPSPWEYRRHVSMTLLSGGQFAFKAWHSHRFVSVASCPITAAPLTALFGRVPIEADGACRVSLHAGDAPEERLVVVESHPRGSPRPAGETDCAVASIEAGGQVAAVHGDPYVHHGVRGMRFRTTAGSFFQANVAATARLVDEVLSRIGTTGEVWDLYGGVGLFAAFAAGVAARVTSVEGNPTAHADAARNLAPFANAVAVQASVEAFLASEVPPAGAAIVDPPRDGLTPEAAAALAETRVPRIVYVSCDPATLSRDAFRLVQCGYALVEVQPIDLFPQTYHLECVALLEKT